MIKIAIGKCSTCPDIKNEALVDEKTKEESRKYFQTIIDDEFLSFKTKLQWANEMVSSGVISKEEAGRLINQQRQKGK